VNRSGRGPRCCAAFTPRSGALPAVLGPLTGRGPLAEAWAAYRDMVLSVLVRFESWEFREGSDLDPTYAALEVLCGRAVARAGLCEERAGAAMLVCTQG